MTKRQRAFLVALADDADTPRAVREAIREALAGKPPDDRATSSLIGRFQAMRSPRPALRRKERRP